MMGRTLLLAGAAIAAAQFGHTPEAQAQDCEIPLGAVLSISGSMAAIGKSIADTGQLAVDHFNEAGGVLGCKVNYLLRDDQGQPNVGVDAAKNLVDVQGVPAIIGAISSGVSLPILTSVAVPAGVTMVSCCSSAPNFTELAKEGGTQGYWFRTLPTSRAQGVVAAKLATDRGYEKVAVIYVNSDYGVNIAKEFQEALQAFGGSVTDMVPYNQEQASYRAEVNKALAGDPDSLFLVAFPADGATVAREWISLGGPDNFVLSNALRADEFVNAVGAKYLTKAVGIDNAQIEGPSVDEFNRTFEARFGTPPNGPGLHTIYDAVAVTLLAAEAGGEAKGSTIRDHIREVTSAEGTEVYPGPEGIKRALELIRNGERVRYVGATGPLQFDEYGDVAGPVLVWGVEDGALAKLDVVTVEQVRDLFGQVDAR